MLVDSADVPIDPTEARRRVRTLYLIAMITFFAVYERMSFNIAFTIAAEEQDVSQVDKGRVLGAFFWGYILTQVPGGYLATRFGGRTMLLISISTALPTIVFAPLSKEYVTWLAACRFLAGIAQGFTFPAAHQLLSQTCEPATRAATVSLVVSCMYLGSGLAMAVVPSLVRSAGPHASFLLTAVGALTWLGISICSGLPRGTPTRGGVVRVSSAPVVPWAAILTSPAMWSIMLSSFGGHIGLFFIMSWSPTFVQTVLGVHLADVGAAAKVLPYVVLFLACTLGGRASDALARRVGVAFARKLMNAGGFLFATPAAMCFSASESANTAFALMGVQLLGLGLARGGFSVNHFDIGPSIAAVLMGFINSAGVFGGALATTLSGWVLEGELVRDRAAWNSIFNAMAAIFVISAAAHCAFGKGDEVLFGDDPSKLSSRRQADNNGNGIGAAGADGGHGKAEIELENVPLCATDADPEMASRAA